MKKNYILLPLLFLLGLWASVDWGNAERYAAGEEVYVSHTELFVMRHGQSKHNLKHLMSSSYAQDITLTDAGFLESAESARALHKEAPIDYIICSPVLRARQTAEVVADELGMSKSAIILDDRLREQYFGCFEGKTYDDYMAQFDHPEDQFLFGAPDGESGEQVARRVTELLREIATSPKYQGKHVLLITHAYPICHISKHFTENWQEYAENSSWTRFILPNHN